MTIKALLLTLLILYPTTLWAAQLTLLHNKHAHQFSLVKRQLTPVDTAHSKKRHIRYQQTYHGIPIWGQHIIAHHDQHHIVYSGQWAHHLKNDLKDTQPSISSTQALLLAKHYFTKHYQQQTDWHFEHPQSKLVIYLDHDNHAHLAYAVDFVSHHAHYPPARPVILIDAKESTMLHYHDRLASMIAGTGPGGNDKAVALGGLGHYQYDGSLHHGYLAISQQHGQCALENEYVKTMSFAGKKTGAHLVTFPCFHHEGDAINGALSPANDAHYLTTQIVDFYQQWYQMRPTQSKLIVRVHYGHNYADAMWDGYAITLGDGDHYHYPLVSLEVIAHEIGHAVTEQNANLYYTAGESGGLNESFSDMAAKAAQYFLYGKVNWNLGSAITKFPGEIFRSMSDPTIDGVSFDHLNKIQQALNGVDDPQQRKNILDPHHTSGIFNKVFYLIATTPGWDPHKAFNIMLYANQNYWTPRTRFSDAAWGIIQSTKELHYPVTDVITALEKVGILCHEDICQII